MRHSALDPPELPRGFWVRPDVRAALEQRDIGTLFRLANEVGKISQIRIGTAVSLSQNRVSLIIRHRQRVESEAVMTRIADGLAMPDHARIWLGLAPSRPNEPQRPAGIPAPSDQAVDLMRQIESARYIDASVIQLLRDETNAIRLLDRKLGAPAVTAKLKAHIDHVEICLRYSLRPGLRQSLADVLAAASTLAGWQAIDMGNLAAAWSYYERATVAAREAADASGLAYAIGEQAYVLADLGRSHDALAMVRAAHDESRTALPHQIMAWLHAAEGEMAASAGEEAACRRALDKAAHQLAYGPSGEDLPYLALNDVHFARWRGNCLVAFGDAEAADGLHAALEAMDSNFTRAEAGLRRDLAAALYVRGELDEARSHLERARELARITGSNRQRRRIRDLARRVGATG